MERSAWIVWGVALVLGFWLPGYLMARALRARAAGLAGFVLSLVVMFWGFFLFNLVGVPIRFGPMLGWELAWCALGSVAAWRWGANGGDEARQSLWLRGADGLMLAMAGVTGAILVLRCALVPLTGPDMANRWDLLARQVLALGHLRYYPPLTDADFRVYGFPESIPPMLSVAHWWMYAAFGEARASLTAAWVGVQYAAIVAFAYRIGERLASGRVGAVAAALVSAATLVYFSLVIGQEAGLMTVAALGVVYFALADEDGGWRGAVLAGACASLGALTREYGLAYVLLGAVLAAWGGRGVRWVTVFGTTCVVLVAPWYVRTWVVAGSPVYSVPVGGVFAENKIVADLYRVGQAQNGVLSMPAGRWRAVGEMLFGMAPVHLVAGGVAVGWAVRRPNQKTAGLGFAVLMLGWLWFASIGISHSIIVWLRALAPAAAVVSVLIALAAVALLKPAWARSIGFLVLVGTWAWTAAFGLVYPRRLAETPPDQWWTAATESQRKRWDGEIVADRVAEVLPAGSRILTTDLYLHHALMGTGYEAVMVWTPEAAFLFDAGGGEVAARLRERGIRAAWLSGSDVWDPFLRERAPFYTRELPGWRPLLRVGGGTLYEVPPATR